MQEPSRLGYELREVHLVTDKHIMTPLEAAEEVRAQRPPELTDAVIVGFQRDTENSFRFNAWSHSRKLDFVLTCPSH